jgi:hypothetical protein
VHYLADTPDGAWAELLRHEEIRDPEDLAGIRRALWAIEVAEPPDVSIHLSKRVAVGSTKTYSKCQEEAVRLRDTGIASFRAPSAALLPRRACGWIVQDGLREGPSRDGQVYVIFGRHPDLVGWPVTFAGSPPEYLLERVRHLS